jgi:hypothetical protein
VAVAQKSGMPNGSACAEAGHSIPAVAIAAIATARAAV